MKVILDGLGQSTEIPDEFGITGTNDVDDEFAKALAIVFKYLKPESTGVSHKLTIELGPTMFTPADFTPRKAVIANGHKFGEISLERFMDLRAMGKVK